MIRVVECGPYAQLLERTDNGTPQRYWLVKSEPECFSIQHLAACPNQTTSWSGVRNYQARNFMRDQMQLGDRVLFYHSSTDPPAVAGTAVIVRTGYPDPTAWDRRDDHFDPKASPDNPIWTMVDLRLDKIFGEPVSISALRAEKRLAGMELLKRGSRLSVQPVAEREFEVVLELAKAAGGAKSDAGGKQSKPVRRATASKPAKRKKKPVGR